MRRLRELEPFSAVEYALSAHVEFAARDFRSALQFARQATVLDSQFWIGQFQLAQVYEQLGDMNRCSEPWRSPNGSVKPTAR